jgi:hypothetical protein
LRGGVYLLFVGGVKLGKRQNSSGAQVNSGCLMGLIRTEFENNNYLKSETEKK